MVPYRYHKETNDQLIRTKTIYGTIYVPCGNEENMPIYARYETLDLLSERGYSSYRLKKEKILTPRTIQKIRNGDRLTMHELEIICDLLKVQPNKVTEWSIW